MFSLFQTVSLNKSIDKHLIRLMRLIKLPLRGHLRLTGERVAPTWRKKFCHISFIYFHSQHFAHIIFKLIAWSVVYQSLYDFWLGGVVRQMGSWQQTSLIHFKVDHSCWLRRFQVVKLTWVNLKIKKFFRKNFKNLKDAA